MKMWPYNLRKKKKKAPCMPLLFVRHKSKKTRKINLIIDNTYFLNLRNQYHSFETFGIESA